MSDSSIKIDQDKFVHYCECHAVKNCVTCMHWYSKNGKREQYRWLRFYGNCSKDGLSKRANYKCRHWRITEEKHYTRKKPKGYQYHECMCNECKTERLFDKALNFIKIVPSDEITITTAMNNGHAFNMITNNSGETYIFEPQSGKMYDSNGTVQHWIDSTGEKPVYL